MFSYALIDILCIMHLDNCELTLLELNLAPWICTYRSVCIYTQTYFISLIELQVCHVTCTYINSTMHIEIFSSPTKYA